MKPSEPVRRRLLCTTACKFRSAQRGKNVDARQFGLSMSIFPIRSLTSNFAGSVLGCIEETKSEYFLVVCCIGRISTRCVCLCTPDFEFYSFFVVKTPVTLKTRRSFGWRGRERRAESRPASAGDEAARRELDRGHKLAARPQRALTRVEAFFPSSSRTERRAPVTIKTK